MKNSILTFLTISFITLGFSVGLVSAESPAIIPKYISYIEFDNASIPNRISIEEVAANRPYLFDSKTYKLTNFNEKPFFLFLQSSSYKGIISNDIEKINNELPVCSSKFEAKAVVGCLILIDKKMSHNFSAKHDRNTLLELREQYSAGVFKSIPITFYGLYDNKLVAIKGLVKFEDNPDYSLPKAINQPQRTTVFQKIRTWFLGIFR